jgi:hypothetical protein
MEWYLGDLARSGAEKIMSRLVDDFADGVIQRKLKAVISCQHAVRDNRDDSQFRLTRVIEVVGQSWLKRVFSRPGPQEPVEGLPDLDEENPIRLSMGKGRVPV